MKISIVASGSRGDVQPYIALGKGLQDAGFAVRVLTSTDFRGLAEGAGLEFCPIGESIEQMLQSPEWRATLESGNFVRILAKMNQELKRRAKSLATTLPPLRAGSELLIAGMGGLGGPFSVAEKLGIPLLQAYVLPFTPTREFPSPLTPKLPFGKRLNRLSFHVMRQVFWQNVRVGDASMRRELGMSRAAFWGPFRALQQQRTPILYGYSSHVLPRPTEWNDHIHVTGYWFLDAPEDYKPPDGLADFIQRGPAPVYIGFGSMSNRNPEEAMQTTLRAIELSGQRAVLASGWGGFSSGVLPDSVYMLDSAPHTWLFPQMAAVVHHGGAGTSAASMRAGVPSIIVPFMGDQPYWGQRIYELGVGPRPIPRKRMTAEHLAQAITSAVMDKDMRQRAAALGERIRAEDGVQQAVRIIQQILEASPAQQPQRSILAS